MSGGILGNAGAPVMGSGILGGFNQFAQDNSASLLGLGAGLLSGQGFSAGAQGFAQGMQQDERTRLIKQKEAEAAQQKLALQQAAQKLGIDPVLAQASPELIGTIAAAKYKPREPVKPEWGVIGENDLGMKQYGWIDPAQRSVTPYQDAAPAQAAMPTAGAGPAVPPAPAGVDPRIWRQEKTKELAQQGQQTPDMKNKLAAAEKSSADLNASLDNYNALVQKYGAEAWNGPAKAQMQSAYTDVLIKMKEAANLGVLNGPDLELMQKQLEGAAVTGFDRVNPFAGINAMGIEGRVGAQVDQIKKSVDRGLENSRRVYGGQSAPQAEKPTPSAQQSVTRGQTATNPKTGERVIYDGKQWVPLRQMQETGGPQA